jgi:hypothetical protein
VPADLGPARTPGGKRESLFDLDADEADLSLAYGLASVEARGRVRFHDAESDIRADRAVYRRESSTVLLEGDPLEIVRGGNKEASPRSLTIRLEPPADKSGDKTKKKESSP